MSEVLIVMGILTSFCIASTKSDEEKVAANVGVFLAFSLGCAITALLMMNYRTVKPEPLLG